MAFFNKIKAVVQTEGARGIRQALQKEGTKRFAQDLSANLAVETLSFCETRRYGLPALISAMAVDPVQSLLACGTFKGAIAVTGAPELAGYLELEEAVSVKMMAFQPGSPVLIVIDAKNAITVFDLIKRQRLFVRNARNIVTCMELLSGSNWLFHGLKDGTIDVFDVYRGQAVPYRIPNTLPEGGRHSMVISIQTHPKDNNQLLIAYNTGVALWNLKLKSVIRTFIYEIPPGAMGGIVAPDGMFGINESRYPHVTVISWRPDGLGFVSGYDDGCFVFWDIRQERPVLARTIHELQVNVPGIRPVFERDSAQFVPIYQLSWCLHENKQDTTLIVGGGTSSIDMYGLHLFEFPAKPDYRSPKRQHMLSMESDILDFIVLPRDSPWFNGAFDPVSILVLTNRGGVKSFSFDASYAPQTVPSALSFVEPRLVSAKVYGHLPQDIYDRLVYGHDISHHQRSAKVARIPLRGIQVAAMDESRLCRDILVTAHADKSIRFWEAASLQPLRHLTVELEPLFFKNQGTIVEFEFSVHSQVLAVGFSNGNWIYGHLSTYVDVSRQPSVARTMPGSPVDDALATSLKEAMNINGHDNAIGHEHVQSLQPIPDQMPTQSPRHQTPTVQEPEPQPGNVMTMPSPPPHQVSGHIGTSQIAPPAAPKRSDTGLSDTGSLMPNEEDLDYLVPHSPVDPASLPNGSEFLSVFLSTLHMGSINQIAVSGCGLIAVSDEFYTLSITDSRSGKVLHVEDLKVVMLDRDRSANVNDDNSTHQYESDTSSQPTHGGHSTVDPQTLQRVGVVITTLQFVVSTTSDQDKMPSLLLLAGSNNGIYMIFAISPPDYNPSQLQQFRRVRKVETFQTKEQYASIHTSIINVLSPSETTAATAAAATQSTPSVSTVSTAATSSTIFTSLTQASGSYDLANQPHPPVPPPKSHSPSLSPRRSEDDPGYAQGHRSSPPESSIGSGTAKPSLYTTLKEVQGKVMNKAQQRLNYLVCVSEYGIRLHMNCTSRRIHKLDLLSSTGTELTNNNNNNTTGIFAAKVGKIMAANVIYHAGACCILCITESGRIILFSVPKLEPIPLPVPGGELFLPIVLEPERLRESIILPDGRILVPILKYEWRMYSLWGHDRWIQTRQGWKQERSAEAAMFLQLYDHGIQIPPRPSNAAASAAASHGGAL
ncbi:hypothetical protein BGZ54_005628, partial [Gamsiella multidivaricata]